jgi:transposase
MEPRCPAPRRPTAPQVQVARARLVLLLHAEPALDHAAAARRLGRHPNWVRDWRRPWAREGCRLADKPGRGRKPAFPPAGGGNGQGPGLRGAGPA